METRANYIAVGAFVLACMIGLVVTVLWLANTGSADYAHYVVKVQGSVTGLGKGTLVRYNGIEAGRVVNFAIDPQDPKKVIVAITIDTKYDIANDATASIASQGLTGGSYVEVLGGSVIAQDKSNALPQDSFERMVPISNEPDGRANPEIHWKPGTLEDLTNRVKDIANKLDKVLSDENIRKLSQTLDHLEVITGTIAARSGDIDQTLRNATVLTANAASAARNIDTAARALPGTLDRANGTLADLDVLTKHADQVVTGDGVAQLGVLIADARRLVTSLTKLSDELNREPTRVIFGDRRKGYTPK
jgi:phospholipid/cholesterol/gamma-HCH transport system substrate-binding protein